jgi:geranylgeranyl diphosphate synthase type II
MHVSHGIPLAVNVGDAMQALSVRLVRRSVDRVGPAAGWRLYDEFEHMLMESLEGQALELGWVRDNDCSISQDDYLLMSLKKTCWYSFIHPCRLGALVARPQDPALDLDRFNRFGFFMGLAFQIQDDVLNLVGDVHKYGKEIGGDLWEGKRTLILIDLMGRLEGLERERLSGILAKPRAARLPREIEWVKERIHRYGSVDVARAAARQFAAAAAQEFEQAYASVPAGPDKQFLRALVQYVVDRDV